MQYYLDAIIRLDEAQLKRFVDAGHNISETVIEDIIMSYGPLTKEILWEKGSGDNERDEQLLREVDAKKARMVQYMIKNHHWFDGDIFLRCYMMRCVEVAKVLLEAGANPNGYNYCENSTFWMMQNGMRSCNRNPASRKIVGELEWLLWDWGAVEFSFNHSCIYYDCSSLQCCDEPFRVGETIRWPGCYWGIVDTMVRHSADFLRAPLGANDEYIISGKIKSIYAMTVQRDEGPNKKRMDDRIFFKIKETKVYWEHPTLDLCGYYVYLTDVEVDFNSDCTRPHREELRQVLENRFGLTTTKTV